VSRRPGIDRRALVDTKRIGTGTRVWEFTHVLAGARIGRDCNLNSHVFVENDVVLGDRVTVKCGVYLWDGVRLEDDVFVGPNATFTNDRRPRSRVQRRSPSRPCAAALRSARARSSGRA
jgi:UDP-3-O-[3-hydroxymyristoyl] glucosamine N-acyltransferase